MEGEDDEEQNIPLSPLREITLFSIMAFDRPPHSTPRQLSEIVFFTITGEDDEKQNNPTSVLFEIIFLRTVGLDES